MRHYERDLCEAVEDLLTAYPPGRVAPSQMLPGKDSNELILKVSYALVAHYGNSRHDREESEAKDQEMMSKLMASKKAAEEAFKLFKIVYSKLVLAASAGNVVVSYEHVAEMRKAFDMLPGIKVDDV